MAAKFQIPRPNANFLDSRGNPTTEWYNWLLDLDDLFTQSDASLQAQITAIAYALGSPDGTVANIPPFDPGGLPDTTMAFGINSVSSFGTLAGGEVRFQLVNDELTPAAGKYYGTNAAGVKGWHELSLSGLSDVDLTGLADGDSITWDLVAGKWVPGSGGGGSGVLPLVTGEVPPVLVYADDGSLIYAPASY